MSRRFRIILILSSLFFICSCGIPNPYYVDTENEPKYSSSLTSVSSSPYYFTISQEFKDVSRRGEPQLYLFYTVEPTGSSLSTSPYSSLTSGFNSLYNQNPGTNTVPGGNEPYSRTSSISVNSESTSVEVKLYRFTDSTNSVVTSFGPSVASDENVLASRFNNPYMWKIEVLNTFNEGSSVGNTFNIKVNDIEFNLFRFNNNGFAINNNNDSYIGNEIPEVYNNNLQNEKLRIWALITTGPFDNYTGVYNSYLRCIAEYSSDNSWFTYL